MLADADDDGQQDITKKCSSRFTETTRIEFTWVVSPLLANLQLAQLAWTRYSPLQSPFGDSFVYFLWIDEPGLAQDLI